MTPKEKAFHLHFSFYRDVIADHEKAKIAALKAVYEILQATKSEIDRPELCETFYSPYWQEVEAEIGKL